ncbi:aspartate carbamoyltransferase regulatory subunit [Hydrogenoanaerobacterium saccharovorans]|uniref:Aspartate carbamoyltransferase regulatory subunit n=1 Tax=Hydrogenoanaerobacterium saccharovorans TaxID=474960 RepID=A0A1H7YZD9_9FIRM|nr:aspartate carbamoyltransferase regulatory subunit [Hydrogenoanaerobacterium saccharovorans]RPF48910.1 aspartate carbamoyltransferase regulatory subunit [Hydrogenoanaerobacterium saccharovorans]SEM51540.1 aspartate carbamoyltransferase regulatory subunit [Hydrogenoanaerobacterium saccharovorans]
MINVDSLNRGVVIDHIRAGKAMEIYKYLELDRLDCSVAIIKNAKSRKMGKKDIIKIDENIDINLDVLGFIDPNISINIINEGGLIEKKKLKLPDQVTNVIKCINPRCITSIEQGINHIFKLADAQNGIYRCIYCEQEFQNK